LKGWIGASSQLSPLSAKVWPLANNSAQPTAISHTSNDQVKVLWKVKEVVQVQVMNLDCTYRNTPKLLMLTC